MSSEADIINGKCVWLLERNGQPYLIYESQDALLAGTLSVNWTLIDSDVMEGTSVTETYYATPWPVHRKTNV